MPDALHPLLTATGAVALLIWVGLWLSHARFWQIEREEAAAEPASWPAVVAIIPARNEAQQIGGTLRSLFGQRYPGDLRIVVVDDESEDGTAAVARETARELSQEARLTVLPSEPRTEGWVGKVWAMHQGVTRGLPTQDPARYVLFSDADILHGPETLRELVSRAETGGYDLVSLMVRLQCRTAPERLMIPAFVFFFRLLYPFRRVNNPRHPLAGAAGGTMLLRREALERIGGLASIRHELIDDCSLAREVKRGGRRIHLALSRASESSRGYGSLDEIIRMIARTAYTQLGYSPLRLLGCVLGLGLTFLAPPLLLLTAPSTAALLGGLAWLLMALLYWPMLRLYGQSPLWAPLLPLTAALYLWATLRSAWRHHRGAGGEWKGRAQSGVATGRRN